MEISVLAAMSV